MQMIKMGLTFESDMQYSICHTNITFCCTCNTCNDKNNEATTKLPSTEMLFMFRFLGGVDGTTSNVKFPIRQRKRGSQTFAPVSELK